MNIPKQYKKRAALLSVATIAILVSGCGSDPVDQAKAVTEIGQEAERVDVTVTYSPWGKKVVFEFHNVKIQSD